MDKTLHFTGGQIGSIYATMGIASLFMPALLGIVADKWINAERVFGMCHIIGAISLFWASTVTTYNTLYPIILLNTMVVPGAGAKKFQYCKGLSSNSRMGYHWFYLCYVDG